MSHYILQVDCGGVHFDTLDELYAASKRTFCLAGTTDRQVLAIGLAELLEQAAPVLQLLWCETKDLEPGLDLLDAAGHLLDESAGSRSARNAMRTDIMRTRDQPSLRWLQRQAATVPGSNASRLSMARSMAWHQTTAHKGRGPGRQRCCQSLQSRALPHIARKTADAVCRSADSPSGTRARRATRRAAGQWPPGRARLQWRPSARRRADGRLACLEHRELRSGPSHDCPANEQATIVAHGL
jgi:hypothetical protein